MISSGYVGIGNSICLYILFLLNPNLMNNLEYSNSNIEFHNTIDTQIIYDYLNNIKAKSK